MRTKRVLSWALVFAMLFSIMPARVTAATTSESLTLGTETQVSISKTDDEATYTYTADEAGRYIIYFKDLSANPIGLGFDPDSIEYHHHPEYQFQGHVVDLNAGESSFLQFMHPVSDYDENYTGYTATVGVAKPVAEADFEGFAPLEDILPVSESDGPSVIVPIHDGQRVLHFFTKQPLAYGVSWTASSDNPDILDLDTAYTSETPVSYSPVFELKAEGSANVTITATYGSKTEAITYSVEVIQGGEGGEEVVHFNDFDSLKAWVESEDQSNRVLVYDGTGDFEVTSDLEVPGYLNLQFEGKGLVVPAGVTFITHNWFECGSLNVAGILNANDRINCNGNVEISGTVNATFAIGLGQELNVTGSLHVGDWDINMQYPATVNGYDNITYGYDYQQIRVEIPYDSMDVLAARLAELNQIDGVHERVVYSLFTPEYQDATLVIDQDITIPSHTTLQMRNWNEYVLAENTIITNNNMIEVQVPFTVKGTLANEGGLNVDYVWDSVGQVIFAEGSEYTGRGFLNLHSAEKTLEEILIGFATDSFYVDSNIDDENVTHWFVSLDGNSGDGSQNIEFETLDELLLEINKEDQSYRFLHAKGTESFEITQDLVIPEYVEIDFHDRDVIIKEGVNIVFNGWTACNNLIIEGHMTLNNWLECRNALIIEATGTLEGNRGFSVWWNLDVQGEMALNDASINMNYPAQISGLDNISWREDWCNIRVSKRYGNAEELADALTAMSSGLLEHSRVRYGVEPEWHEEGTARIIQITKDITIPELVELMLWDNYECILEENVTLTNNGEISIAIPMVIKGSCVNNGRISITNERDGQGKITLDENGSFSGNGNMWVHHWGSEGSPSLELQDIIPGFKLDDFDVIENRHDDGSINWEIIYVGGLIKLGTPVNLRWGVEYIENRYWDEETGIDRLDGYTVRAIPGMMSWDTVTPDQAEAVVKIYEVGKAQPVAEVHCGFDPQMQPEYRSSDWFLLSDLPTGYYYFTVQSRADYKEYRNSDVATSDVYYYIKPNAQLQGVDNATLHWEDDYSQGFYKWAAWAYETFSGYVDGYSVEYWYSPTIDGEFEHFGGVGGRGNNRETREPLHDDFIQDRGEGYYKFKVRVLSNDIEKACNSEWSDFSPILDLVKVPEDVTNDLDNLVNQSNNMTADDIRTEVQKIDAQDLKAALLTDQENNGAVEKLAELEQKAGGQAPVTVTQDASAFNANEVSIVGANLNSKSEDADSDIELILDKPEKDHVIPERYNSSVAVKFSMTLENVEDPKNLAVPVKITLPIPASINPEFLVVLHYHEDGSHELIRPYVYEKDNKWYADFVLTSFSDFVLTHECHWDEGEETTPHSCDEDGEMTYHCTVEGCEEIRKVPVPAGHTPDESGYKCKDCGADLRGLVTPTAADFTFAAPTELTYDGTEKIATVQVADAATGMGDITIKYYDEEGNLLDGAPINAGKYTVKIDVAEGSSYTAATDLNNSWWTFEIAKTVAEFIAPTAKTGLIYTGEAQQLINEGSTEHGTFVYFVSGEDGETTAIPTGTMVTTYDITYYVKGDENHYDSTAGILTVIIGKSEQVPMEIIGIPDVVIYGDEFTLSTTGGSGTGYQMWEISSGTYNATIDENGKVTVVGAGDFTINTIKFGDSNYEEASCSIDVIAQKKVVSMSVQVEDKVYDGTTEATISEIIVDGLLSNDIVNVNTHNAKAVFEDKNVGENKRVFFSGFELDGDDVKNYTLASQPQNVYADISKRNVNVTATAPDKIYDGTTDVDISQVVLNFDGILDGETVDYKVYDAFYGGSGTNENHTVLIGFNVIGEDAANYAFPEMGDYVAPNYFAEAKAAILPRELTLTVVVEDKQYDGLDTATIKSVIVNNLVEGQTVEVTNGIATFDSVNVAENIGISFTDFAIGGDGYWVDYYILKQPTSVTASITNNWTPAEYIVSQPNGNGWLDETFEIKAMSGYLLALTNTADGEWSNALAYDAETADGSVTFYIKNIETKAISLAATESYKVDKTAPTGTVEFVERKAWQEFLNNITFGLFFNEEVKVVVTAEDVLSGVGKIEYIESASALTLDTLKATGEWTTMVNGKASVTAEDAKKFVYYIRITDKAGNVAYLSTDGAEFDTQPPIINGITDGAVYYTTQRFTVAERNLESVTVNGNNSIAFALGGNVDKEYVIVATDLAGNSTTVTVTMKTIVSLSEAIKDLTADNVTADHAQALLVVEDALAAVDTTNAFEDEIQELEAAKANVDALKKVIADTLDEINALTDAVAGFDKDTIKSTDKEAVDKLIADITAKLEDTNLTAEQKERIETVIEKAVDIAEKIESDTAAYNDVVNAEKETTADNYTVEAKSDLEKAVEDLKDVVNDDNYTAEEKQAAQTEMDRIQSIIDDIKEIEAVEKDIYVAVDEAASVEDATVLPDSEDVINAVIKAYEGQKKLDDKQKELLGEEATGKLADLVTMITAYKIVKGADNVFTKGSSNTLSFTVNGAFALFKAVKVNGTVLDANLYTAKAGSTIVELATTYLNTLATGKYSLEVVYEVLGCEYSATGEFEIKNAPVVYEDDKTIADNTTSTTETTGTSSPSTGDDANTFGWFFAMLASIMALAFVLSNKKKIARR